MTDQVQPFQNVGSCDGFCPPYGTRCSPCPQLSTEDDRTPIELGMRLYNYYDRRWGTVTELPGEYDAGWFRLSYDDGGSDRINGARCSTKETR